MSVPNQISVRPPCGTVPNRQIGPFSVHGELEGARRSQALIAREGENPESICILRRPLQDESLEIFHADTVRSSTGSARVKSLPLEIAGETFAKSRAFVSEPISLLLARTFEHVTPLPLPVALSIAYGILQCLKQRGEDEPHGDLAPQHVLIGYDGTVELIDPAGMNQAKIRSKEPSRRAYRSPEHVTETQLCAGSDIFVAGTYLYEMTTGEPMFSGTDASIEHQILSGQYRRPRSLVGKSYPIELQVVLRKMLNTDLNLRFSSAQNAIEGLNLVSGPSKKQQARVIQAYMHKNFPEYYDAWREVYSAAGNELPPPEVTDPIAQPLELTGGLSQGTSATSRSDTQARTASAPLSQLESLTLTPPMATTQAELTPVQTTTQSQSTPLQSKDLEPRPREEPTHVAALTPELRRLAEQEPSRKLPPMHQEEPSGSEIAPAEEITNPHADISSSRLSAVDRHEEHTQNILEQDPEPTPTPATPQIPEDLAKELSEIMKPTPSSPKDLQAKAPLLDEIIPELDHEFRASTVADHDLVTPGGASIGIPQVETENAHSLIDTSDLSLEEDNLPLNPAEIDHLRLAADLLVQPAESTERAELKAVTPTPFAETETAVQVHPQTPQESPSSESIPRTSGNHIADEETGKGLAIPKPRKITPRSHSDWTQPLSGGNQEPAAPENVPLDPVRPRPLERLTRDSIIQAPPADLLESSGEEEDVNSDPSQPVTVPQRQQPTQVVRDRILSKPQHPTPNDLASQPISPSSEFMEEPAASEALVLPISDTTLNKEYLRQKKLVRIGFTGVAILLAVIFVLIFQIINERSAPSSIETKPVAKQPDPKKLTPPKPSATTVVEPSDKQNEPPAEQPKAAPQPAPKKTVVPLAKTKVTIQAFPSRKAKIFIDGQRVENGSEIEISTQPRKLVIKAKGYKTYRETLKVGRKQPVEVLLNRR